MGHELRYYPFRKIRGYLSRFGEMRFGRKAGSADFPANSLPSGSPAGGSSAVIDLPPATPAGTTFAFVVDEHLDLYLRSAPGMLCCDWGEIVCENDGAALSSGAEPGNPRLEISYKIQSPCFIYDKARSFVLGVDPRNLEIWELSPEAVGASIEVEKLKLIRKCGKNGVSGIENISFTIRPAEFVGIYGGSGAGKTTLINRILSPEYHPLSKAWRLWQRVKNSFADWWAGRQDRLRGNVRIDGASPVKAVDSIAYLPQRVSLPAELTCKEIFELAAADRGTVSRNEITKRIALARSLCALDESILYRRYGVLSGGEKRRAALAVALLRQKTKLLIVDEPTTGLDISSELSVMNSLRTISRHGITVIAVTHSVAACRLFDRVLILRKDPASRRGASLAFNGLWHEDSLPGCAGLSDMEILERYTDPDEPELTETGDGPTEKHETVWPFGATENAELPIEHEPPAGREPRFRLTRAALRGFRALLFDWFALLMCQTFNWLKVSSLIQWRNRKRLTTFGLLAAVCVVIIQLGTSHVKEGNIQPGILMITLLTLAASWLCAIFAALAVADQLRFFAWEHFSGLRTLNFVVGMFSSMVPVAASIALIFNVGIFFSIDNAKLEKMLPNFSVPQNVERTDKNSRPFWNPIVKTWEQGQEDAEGKFPTKNLPGFLFVKNATNRHRGYQCEFQNSSAFWRFCKTWLAMTLICLFGCSVGIFMHSIFREKIQSITAIVVLYIFYLLFSRLFIIRTEGIEWLGLLALLVTCGPIKSACYLTGYSGYWVAILLSFLSISRYAFNAVFYSAWTITITDSSNEWIAYAAHEEFVIACFTLAIVFCSNVLYRSKNRNWRSISK